MSSSYQKNTSNQSGVVIDNLQVNKTANIPNTITIDGDYIGDDGIAGTKQFKNNTGFKNGISVQGSSTINDLTITGTFTTPGGGVYVDTTTNQTIDGDKTFTKSLTSNNIKISGTSTSNITYSDTAITNQNSTLSGTTLTLSESNLNIGIGQKIDSSLPITVYLSDAAIFEGVTFELPSNLLQVGSVISGPNIPIGTTVTEIRNSTIIISNYIILGGFRIESTIIGTSLTLTGINSAIKIGLNVYRLSYGNEDVLFASIVSGSGLNWTLSNALSLPYDTTGLQPYTFKQPFTFTRNSLIPNTIITGGSGLTWTLNKSMNIPTSSSIQFYNPTTYIQPTQTQINNLTVYNGLTLASGGLNIPSGIITNSMLQTPYQLPSILPPVTSNSLNISGAIATVQDYNDTPLTSQVGGITGSTLTLSALNSSVAIGQQISTGYYSATPFNINCYFPNTDPPTIEVFSYNSIIPQGAIISGTVDTYNVRTTVMSKISSTSNSTTYFIDMKYWGVNPLTQYRLSCTLPAIQTGTVITAGSGLTYTLNKTVPSNFTNAVISFYNPSVMITTLKSQMNNLTVINGLNVKSGTVSLPAGSITNTMLASPYNLPSTLPAISCTGLFTCSNGLSVTGGTLTLQSGSVTNSMLATPYVLPSTLPATTFSGTVTATNGLQVQGGTSQLGSNYASTDAANVGLFVGDAKYSITSNTTGIISIPNSLVKRTSFRTPSGATVNSTNGMVITTINTTSNVFVFGTTTENMIFTIGTYYIMGLNSGQPSSSGPNKFFTVKGSTSSVISTSTDITERVVLVSSIPGGTTTLSAVVSGAKWAYAWF